MMCDIMLTIKGTKYHSKIAIKAVENEVQLG